jgi:hypothetical protein
MQVQWISRNLAQALIAKRPLVSRVFLFPVECSYCCVNRDSVGCDVKESFPLYRMTSFRSAFVLPPLREMLPFGRRAPSSSGRG